MVCKIYEGIKFKDEDHKETGFWNIGIDNGRPSKYLGSIMGISVKLRQGKISGNCDRSDDRFLWGYKEGINTTDIINRYATVLERHQYPP